MNKKTNLLLASALFLAMQPLQALAVVGQVEFSTVGVVAINQSGATRALNKGSEIDIGDTIQTNDARAQLRFTDGGYISLQPNTAFKVEDYAYTTKKDGTDKSFFNLIKGGMRAITGLVGKTNKQAYRLNTPVATIGIRGTEFVAEYDIKLLVKVDEGAVYIANNAGDITLYAGQIGEVGDSNDKPALTDEEPSVGAKGPEGGKSDDVQEQAEKESEQQNQFLESEQTNQQGEVKSIAGLEPPLTSYTGPVAWSEFGDGADIHIETTDELKFNSSGKFIGYIQNGNEVQFTGDTVDKGHIGDNPGDRLSWMRLTGGTFIYTNMGGISATNGNSNTETNDNTHVIFGQFTSTSQMQALAGSEITAIYNLAGGTRTTNSSGVLGSITSGTLTANFSVSGGSVGLSMVLTSGGNIYDVEASGHIEGVSAKYHFNSNNSNCGVGCNFNGKGFFSGENAGKAALTYAITNQGVDIIGVAGFVKSGTGISTEGD